MAHRPVPQSMTETWLSVVSRVLQPTPSIPTCGVQSVTSVVRARNAYNKERKDRQERAATTVFERALALRPEVMAIAAEGGMAEVMAVRW